MVPSRFLPPRFHTPLFAVVVAVLTYFTAKIGGVLIISVPQTLWPLWPGCAVLAAILLISPRKLWPILIAAGISGFVVYDLQAGVPLSSIFWLILTDVFEILVAAGGVSYFLGQTPRLDNLKSFATYALFTVLLGPFVGAVLSTPSLLGDRWISLRSNFISEGFAFLTITPAILGWVADGRAWLRNRRGFRLEGSVLFLSLSALCYLMFIARGPGGHLVTPALLYSLVPFLLWAALRFGYTGAGTAASIVALLSIWGAIHGRGPFIEIDPIHRVLTIQLFLWCSAVPFMVLAVLVEERRQQASVLRESEERFRLMADTAPTLIWMSGTNKLCTFFSHGWLAFTGRTLEQELGEGWADGVHPGDLDRCLAIYSGAFDSRMKFAMEYRLRRHDGEYRWIVDYGVPRFGSNGDFLGYIGSCIDITERKLSEMSLHELSGRLIHAQEEERARIARELHDDISQRMAFLQIGLDQFEQTLGGLTANEKNELHNLVEVASEVSSDLHNISHRLHPARLDLQGLVAATKSFCKEVTNQQDIEIKFVYQDVPPQLPSSVALCLFRIIQEALRNVVKHARTNQATVVLTGHPDRIELSISDNGAGFQPADADSRHGLGLISMRERLRLIDGRLAVDSSPTHGTRIQVQVPLKIAAPSELTSQPKSHKATA
jgi:PAS domain S-box-containing protein